MQFNNMQDLVTFYTLQTEGLCTLLTIPCPKAGPYLKDFSHAKDKWEISRKAVTLDKKLGEGEFGAVYQGWWNGFTPVCVGVSLSCPLSVSPSVSLLSHSFV